MLLNLLKTKKAKSKTIKNNYNPEEGFTANFNIKQEKAV